MQAGRELQCAVAGVVITSRCAVLRCCVLLPLKSAPRRYRERQRERRAERAVRGCSRSRAAMSAAMQHMIRMNAQKMQDTMADLYSWCGPRLPACVRSA